MQVPADVEQLTAARAFLSQQTALAGLDERSCSRLALALEEVFVNICHYAYPADAPGMIELHAEHDARRFCLDVIDDGVAMDTAGIPEPDLSADLQTRAVGGLGWFLARRLVTELRCWREQGRNRVRLIVERPADALDEDARGRG